MYSSAEPGCLHVLRDVEQSFWGYRVVEAMGSSERNTLSTAQLVSNLNVQIRTSASTVGSSVHDGGPWFFSGTLVKGSGKKKRGPRSNTAKTARSSA